MKLIGIDNEVLELLKRLWNKLQKKRKKQFIDNIIIMSINGLLEFITLGTLIPFISIIINPNIISETYNIPFVNKLISDLSKTNIIILVSTFFLFIVILSLLFKFIALKVNSEFVFGCSHDLSVESFRKAISISYKDHTKRNSSEVINNISGKVNSVVYGSIQPLIGLIYSLIISTCIFLLLISVNPLITLVSISLFSLYYSLSLSISKTKLNVISKTLVDKSTQSIKIVQEAFGGYRDVILDDLHSQYTTMFSDVDKKFKSAQRDNYFIGQIPKTLIDSILIVSIIIISLFMVSANLDIVKYIPVLGAFILAAQKLLPLLNNIFNAITNVQAAKHSMIDVISMLELQDKNIYIDDKEKSVDFKDNIMFKNVSYSYDNDNYNVLNDFNLKINKGEKIGLVGKTGSGKSTVIDILMGLLEPSSGKILIDNNIMNNEQIRNWQKKIAHVPQNIFLSDQTIIENIAFGIFKNNIDVDRVNRIIDDLLLKDLILKLPNGIYSRIGERGAMLSGGEKQRIVLARAIYKNADILILDEATSALDVEIERKIINIINEISKDITIIFVAHRLSTLEICDKVYEIQNGQAIKINDLSKYVAEKSAKSN